MNNLIAYSYMTSIVSILLSTVHLRSNYFNLLYY